MTPHQDFLPDGNLGPRADEVRAAAQRVSPLSSSARPFFSPERDAVPRRRWRAPVRGLPLAGSTLSPISPAMPRVHLGLCWRGFLFPEPLSHEGRGG